MMIEGLNRREEKFMKHKNPDRLNDDDDDDDVLNLKIYIYLHI